MRPTTPSSRLGAVATSVCRHSFRFARALLSIRPAVGPGLTNQAMSPEKDARGLWVESTSAGSETSGRWG